MSEHFYQDNFGSIKITLEDNIITAEFSGAVSPGIARFLLEKGREVKAKINVAHWGYISNSLKAEASTPEAQKILLQAAAEFKQTGCVRGVFLLTSAIAIAQMEALRAAVGITEPFRDVLFDKYDDAKIYLDEYLQKYND